MVKAEVKTPNKRKSLANDTPAKKIKLENGKSNNTPKKTQQTPAKTAQQKSPNQKLNKKNKIKSEKGSPKDIKPFKGTKNVLEQPKPKKPQPIKKEGETKQQQGEKRKRRRAQYSNLVSEVKTKQGSKDDETLKKLDEKIQTILSRGELTKTAKRKLSLFKKLKSICEQGSAAVAEKNKAEKEAALAEKAKKKAEKQVAKKVAPQAKAKAAPVKKQVQVKKQEDDDDDEEDDDEEESDAEEAGDEEADSDDDEAEAGDEEDSDEAEGEESDDEEDDDDEEEDDDEDEDDDDDDESEEEAPKVQGKPPSQQAKNKPTQSNKPEKSTTKKDPSLDQLKAKDLVKKGQKRFVLFVGNIPYDATKQDLTEHFAKVGNIVHVRIPTLKGTKKPRGFAYLEVQDEVTYEKCLSMHHSQMKGRRINVLYTQGGKKKGEDKKKEIKAKNMKLGAMRRQGKLAGSVKETQKRSFRRNKAKNRQENSGE